MIKATDKLRIFNSVICLLLH